jgi:kynurenine formamidase
VSVPRTDALLAAITAGTRVYDLAQPLHPRIPHSPNHPGFRFALIRRHGDHVREDGGSAANELLVTGGHVGTHVDALAHVSHDGRLHGGVEADAVQGAGGFSRHGIDQMEPVVARGILLDVCALHGVARLEPGQPVGPEDLDAAAERAGVEPGAGDVVLVRTGWAQLWEDPDAFLSHAGGVPGPTEAAARALAARGIRATGSDTTAYEHIPAGRGHAVLPVHRVLLVEHGVHIIEMLDLEGLAADGVTEFCFVLAPLKIVGGTGSPVRPLAVIADAEEGARD